MKTLITTLLTLFSLSSFAMTNNNNIVKYYTSPTSTLTENYDTSTVVVENSETTVAANDSTANVNITTNATLTDSLFETYQDVNVEVIEGNNSTRIVVHKDGDTIKNYEMNYDFDKNAEAAKNTEAAKETKEEKNNFNFEFNFGDDENGTCTINKKKKKRFKGHWSGFEFGLNNYLTDDFSVTPDEEYMEINTGKSWNFNLNFAQFSIPLIRDRFGLVTGLGIEWCNYHFSNGNTIDKNQSTHQIEPVDISHLAMKKNKLTTTYITTPLLMEVQIGNSSNRDKRMAVSAGLIGGLKIGSYTKYKTSDSKEKNKDDFYLQSFRYGFTARINYDSFGFYFNYYNVPLFVKDKGPELYPFAAGLLVSFN